MPRPNGVVHLIKNAVVDNTYQHTIDFRDASEQYAYWRSLSKYSLTDYSYLRKQREYLNISKSLEELEDVNYLVFRSSDSSRLIYAFVTDKEYNTDYATYVYFEVDVLQTYLFDYKLNPSYVLREHSDRWTPELKPKYSRTEEGLEYGSEYTLENGYKVKPKAITNTDGTKSVEGIKWFIIVSTRPTAMEDSGAVLNNSHITDAPTPFIYYLVPMLPNKNYLGIQVSVSSRVGPYTSNVSDFKYVMEYLNTSSLGQYFKQIYYLPYCPIDFTLEGEVADGYMCNLRGPSGDNLAFQTLKDPEKSRAIQMMVIYGSDGALNPDILASMDALEGLQEALPPAELWKAIKDKPTATERDRRFESKLLTYPYRYNLLTDWRNAPLIIKNEYLTKDKLDLKWKMSLGFNGPTRYYIDGYRKDVEGRALSLVQELPLEQPIVTDAYYTYMLQNKNQINQNRNNTIIAGISNTATSAFSGFMAGGAYGAVAGAVTGAVSAGTSVATHIASENAKQRDIRNYPDTIISSDDCSLALLDDNLYVTFYRYKICCEFEEQLAQYWHMYGYVSKQLKLPNLKSRKRFNYIKTIGANITGNVNQSELEHIRAIFDNGVTFWHYSEDNFKPRDYTYENIEVSLL